MFLSESSAFSGLSVLGMLRVLRVLVCVSSLLRVFSVRTFNTFKTLDTLTTKCAERFGVVKCVELVECRMLHVLRVLGESSVEYVVCVCVRFAWDIERQGANRIITKEDGESHKLTFDGICGHFSVYLRCFVSE